MTLRHASFFSGVGGLDLGFERAGIKTVSFSEIDPYASAVLATHWPDVPNLGNIVELKEEDIPNAEIYSGGFPCQDLSVAGKRAGFAGARSSLAFRFLEIVERRNPRWVLLENVTGLFSSNGGRDFGRLLDEMVSLGYGVAWRTLDARFFGVPQRRRRVFIVAARDEAFGGFGADRAAEVLFECEGLCGHIATSGEAGEETPGEAAGHASRDRGRSSFNERDSSTNPEGMRAVNGLAGRLDDRGGLEVFGATTHRALQARDWKVGVSNQDIGQEGFLVAYQTRVDEKSKSFTLNEVETANSLSALWPGDTSHRSMTLALSFPTKFGSNAQVSEEITQPFAYSAGAPAVFRKAKRAQTSEDDESWVEGDFANTLNNFDVGDVRTTHAVISSVEEEDERLPLGLDGHRYRCAGNGVVSNVAEWIGRRFVAVDKKYQELAK